MGWHDMLYGASKKKSGKASTKDIPAAARCPNTDCGSGHVRLLTFRDNEENSYAVECQECKLRGPRLYSKTSAMKYWNDFILRE